MQSLQLRPEFLTKFMPATAIELMNQQNTGWAQRPDPAELLEITYPTSDVQRALEAVSASAAGRPVVFIGPRGRGKSHLMALLHHAFVHPDAVQVWAKTWGVRVGSERLQKVSLTRRFLSVSATMLGGGYACLWDPIFDGHPRGPYYRGKFEQSGTTEPSKPLLLEMFGQQPMALILDELQSWFDALHDEPTQHGPKRRQWAFNFIQTLSELAAGRPDLFSLIVSVRDNTTEAFRQIHRVGPALIDFSGETAREDRKRLVLHRLFQNHDCFPDAEIDRIVDAYAGERNRLLFVNFSTICSNASRWSSHSCAICRRTSLSIEELVRISSSRVAYDIVASFP